MRVRTSTGAARMALVAALLVLAAAALPSVMGQAQPIGGTGNGGTNTGNANNGNANAGNANGGNAAAGGNANGQQAAGSTAAPSSSAISIPQDAAAGGITITQPAQTADASYYKIQSGVQVTFGWNFTSIISYPQNLTVAAFNLDNRNTYTITNNLPGTATAITWSPYDYDQQAIAQNAPTLGVATYRLMIYDSRGPDANANVGGVFNPNKNVQFALYIPSKYTPLSAGWICGSCNGAYSLKASPLAVGIMATLAVMVASGWSVLARSAGMEA